MRLPISLGLALLTGVLVVRERQTRRARQAAERVAAATLEALLRAIDANDPQTGAHVRRVAAGALVLADAVGLDEHDRRAVERIALFHDIGKIDEALFDIIHERSRLTRAERRAVATHPARGADVLGPLSRFYPELAEGVLSHHERWDGTGYPRGLREEEIPLAARLVTLADTFDAITHSRRYRGGRSARAAATLIAEGRGTQFDPALVDLLLSPPVFDRLVRANTEARRAPRVTRSDERRRGERERHVPDVTFRWRSESRASRPRDRVPKRSRT